MKPCVVIMSNVDWDGLQQQMQRLARAFGEHGYDVYYFNRTLQRVPSFRHVLERLLPGRNAAPAAPVRVVTPYWLPPLRILRPLNRLLIRRTLARLPVVSPLFITYPPTYHALDMMDILRPETSVYINVHNYDADEVLADLRRAEKELARRADILCADSGSNRRRLAHISGGRGVHPMPPGADCAAFRAAFRGDEAQRAETACYFGRIGPHLDMSLYRALAASRRVVFIGDVDPGFRVPDGITVRPAVPNGRLPLELREADLLALFYADTPYLRAVLPSKFFECLATNKPVLVSGIPEARRYGEAVYDADRSAETLRRVLADLPRTETGARIALRSRLAREAGWDRRFAGLEALIRRERRRTVSFIVVAKDAGRTLPALLSDLAAQAYPPDRLEVLLVDGGSRDATRRVMEGFREGHPGLRVRVLDNPRGTLACGWNVALAHSSGEVILRVDAHGRIPPDFIAGNVRALGGGEAIAGGPRLTRRPEGRLQKLLSFAERSKFGSGIADYRTCRPAGYVDTLAHAAYRREVFEKVGGYDERLGRTEDNEMHYRMKRAGFRFYFSPEIRSVHAARGDVRALLAQKFGNGLWVGLTLGVRPGCLAARHFASAVFTAAFLGSFALALAGSRTPFAVLMLAYLAAAGAFSAREMARSTRDARALCLFLPALFFAVHLAYGLGTLAGLVRMPLFAYWSRGYAVPHPCAREDT